MIYRKYRYKNGREREQTLICGNPKTPKSKIGTVVEEIFIPDEMWGVMSRMRQQKGQLGYGL